MRTAIISLLLTALSLSFICKPRINTVPTRWISFSNKYHYARNFNSCGRLSLSVLDGQEEDANKIIPQEQKQEQEKQRRSVTGIIYEAGGSSQQSKANAVHPTVQLYTKEGCTLRHSVIRPRTSSPFYRTRIHNRWWPLILLTLTKLSSLIYTNGTFQSYTLMDGIGPSIDSQLKRRWRR